MFKVVDATEPDTAPSFMATPANSLFFLAWVGFGGYLCTNLFIGVIMSEFNKVKCENDGSAFMSPMQQQWVEMKKIMLNTCGARRRR